MVDKTRSIDKIQVSDNIMKPLIKKKKIENIEKLFCNLLDETEKRICSSENECDWIKIINKPFYYVDGMLIVDIERKYISSTEFSQLPGFVLGGISRDKAVKLFYNNKIKNPLLDKNGYISYTDNLNNGFSNRNYLYIADGSSYPTYCFGDNSNRTWGITNMASVKLPTYSLSDIEKSKIVTYFLKNNLNIYDEEEDKEKNKCFDFLANLYSKEQIICDKEQNNPENENNALIFGFNDKTDIEQILKFIENNDANILGHDFADSNIKTELIKSRIDVGSDMYNFICDSILSCDETRVHMEKYPEYILKDPESGHWELWHDDDKSKKSSDDEVNINGKLVARNPVYDALNNRSGVVGIDFGTKSTVVTYRQSRADVLPMRIGSGKYGRAVSMEDYENPTVMELRDVKAFMEAYSKKAGRPLTCWNDLLISHEAFSQMKDDQRSGDTFATFFSELKQWANDKERQVTLRDAKNTEIEIPPYMNLKDGDFDPIEIYAYYIGMFINNMVHKIYLRYKMSFPAKIEKSVRDKILKSFERGIKKSLPQAVLNDDECMKIFRVEQGASEPAAYAICALQEYGFDPEDDEKMYYGIFDFGGGTTDFDFGIWSSSDENDDNHDYMISRFGEGEDQYLGGENILAVLAYNVFLDNYEKLSEKNIIFTKPYGEKEQVGREWLISQDSQYAHFNSKHMMEKLRGVWEGDAEVRKKISDGTIQVTLLDRDGKQNNNFAIEVSLEKLDSIIEKRIDSGVEQFFSTLKNCFDEGNSFEKIHDIDKINIFLAGNSCKSSVVFKLFKKYIDELYSNMPADGKKWIKVYPPLGSEQAIKVQRGELEPDIDSIIKDLEGVGVQKKISSGKSIQKTGESKVTEIKKEETENNAEKSSVESRKLLERISRPNGKTGVAFGLLDTRVKVVQNESEESSFKYYIGQNRKKKFKCIIDKDKQKYGQWKRFCQASVDTFDIWFTRTANAPSNSVSINEIGIYSETGFIDEPSEDKAVYIKLVSPTDIEYTVSSLTEEEINKNEVSIKGVERITLQEK